MRLFSKLLFANAHLFNILMQNVCQDGVDTPQVVQVLASDVELFLVVLLESQLRQMSAAE